MESTQLLPGDAAERHAAHAELHARPAARVRLPALVIHVAVRPCEQGLQAELEHLRRLPGQEDLQHDDLSHSFLRVRLAVPGVTGCLKWERHSEFTRYSLTLPLDTVAADEPELGPALSAWLRDIPGETLAALQLAMRGMPAGLEQARQMARRWLGDGALVASRLGSGAHSLVYSDLRVRDSGFERILLLTDGQQTELRNGRVAQRLLELQTYRVMALLGLPVAKSLGTELNDCEQELARLTDALQDAAQAAQQLERLISLAARVEHLTARHGYRFAATRAYHGIVLQRLSELGEAVVPGLQTLGAYTLRRLTPAVATVQSTADRLESLSRRIGRCAALLRTRVDIAAESRQQGLLSRLARGQALQLRLQTTVEGLSIAAISYYVVSLLGYGLKAMKSAGLPIDQEIATGCLVPLVLWIVWRGTQRIHARLAAGHA